MPRLPVGSRLGQLVQKDCQAAEQALAARGRVHAHVHDARKAIRRVRSILALVEDGLDVGPADRALQRVGDSLSRLRDAYAAIGTSSRVGELEVDSRWAPVTAALRARADSLVADAQARDPRFLRRRQAIRKATLQLDGLPWETVKASDLRDGLERQRERVTVAAARARKAPTPDNLHRWRRRARRLRMQFDALATLELGGLQSPARQSRELRRLADDLGWHQDVDVLIRLVRRLPGLGDRKALVARLEEMGGTWPRG